ncbi:MAG: biotin/lipoyl-binding protein [Bacteroidales bacterium]|jgi:biotin carboxyl carrier protein|nr:biotin/lipoyl-binding protein [Bacteroidales bacterium]
MKNYTFKIQGRTYNVDLLSQDDNKISLEVNGTPYEVTVEKGATKRITTKTPVLVRAAAPAPAKEGTSPSGSVSIIKSPLPGNILSILVHQGDTVQKGQKLLTYEAMKMENDILAESNGTVTKIFVNVGDTIIQGANLVEIK